MPKSKKKINKKPSKKKTEQKPIWTPNGSPPTFDEIREWLGTNDGLVGNTD